MNRLGRSGSRLPRRAAAGIIAVASALTFAGCGGSDKTTAPETGTPCGGTEITLAEARSAAPFEVVEPRTSIASADDLATVWQCSTVAGGYLLLYDSGVGVLESVNTLNDPVSEWQGLAEAYKEFSVGEINGIPASFADPAAGAVGGVDFVVGDVRYTVSGDGSIPLDDLVAVADSLPVAGSA
jgi:hypothetical protein